MAFWGIEIKPGKPYIHRPDDEGGRLHVSQATLGAGSSVVKTIVQCKVGNKTPIYLCSLLPDTIETCALNLEFEEEDEVTLSVVGDLSVHLSGFFYGDNEDQDNQEDEYGSDPYEEDVMVTDSDDEDYSSSFESDDEIGDDSFHTSSPPPVSNSGVRIEEIVDDEKTTDGDGMSKKANNKRIRSVMSGDDENSNRQIVVKAGNKSPLSESEDEDGFPISAYEKKPSSSISDMKSKESSDKGVGEKVQKKNVKSDVGSEKNFKKQINAVSKDGEHARETIETRDSSAQPDDKVKKRKNKKKKVADKIDGSQDGKPNSNVAKEAPVADVGNDLKTSSETKKEKKGNKKNNQQESVATPNAIEKPIDGKGSILEKQETREAKSLQVRSFPNGLVIEELGMGKPAGKRASPGKKVSVHYIGKLKKDGKIFDSNIGRPPFKFRLGIGEVIKGWDVGVNGMRVGDKRRLTIPPAMGYGAKGCGPKIPPNSWLVFDVELDDVNETPEESVSSVIVDIFYSEEISDEEDEDG